MRRTEALDPAFLPAPSPPRRFGRQLLAHVRIPLYRDGYALALNSAFTAATGLLYWIVAAKSYSAHAVGLNSALISSMMFLAGVASLNLPNILVRFLPESGDLIRRRAAWSYLTAAVVGVCAALVFVAGVGAWAPRLHFLGSNHGLAAWFAFSTLAWCLFVLQDSVLIALGRAILVPVENAVFSLLKLALLAVLAALLPLYGIFVSWTIAMLVSVVGVNVLIFARLMPRPSAADVTKPIARIRDRAFARYFAADYVCSVAWLSTTNLMPVVVTAVAGATTNAYWALAYAVALPLYAFAQNIGTSLILHGTNDRAALPSLTRKAAIQGVRVLIPAVALLVVLAPYLLDLFGGSYAHRSTTLLRLLALGALPNFVLSLAVSVARVQRRLRRAVIAAGSEALLALGLAVPLLKSLGVTGVGVAWIGAQGVVAAGLLLTWRSALAADPGIETAPDASAAALHSESEAAISPDGRSDQEASEQVARGDVESEGSAVPHPCLRGLFEALEGRGIPWTLLRLPSSLAAPTGDIDLLVAPGEAEAFSELAAEHGFVALPGWESSPDRIFVRYDRPTDQWLLLEVSTVVSFNSPRGWRIAGAAEQILQRRQLTSSVALPDVGDAFWLTLLHCLLDKGAVAEYHRERLRSLAPAAARSPLGLLVCSAAGPAFVPEMFEAAVRSGDWQRVVALGRSLSAELERRRPNRERLRVLRDDSIRLARKPLLLHRRRGVNIALLGPNGVGKSTAAAGLRRAFPFESRVVYMGVWKQAMKPRRRPMVALEILDRPFRLWRSYLTAQYHQLRGRLVVFDRYVYEALLPAHPPLLLPKRLYFRLLFRALPPPIAVVVLDVPGDVAYGRKQENPPDELESERRIYARLATDTRRVKLVDATADAATVRADITAIVWRALVDRWQGHRSAR